MAYTILGDAPLRGGMETHRLPSSTGIMVQDGVKGLEGRIEGEPRWRGRGDRGGEERQDRKGLSFTADLPRLSGSKPVRKVMFSRGLWTPHRFVIG